MKPVSGCLLGSSSVDQVISLDELIGAFRKGEGQPTTQRVGLITQGSITAKGKMFVCSADINVPSKSINKRVLFH